jgi:hypothetical protein
MRWIQVRENVGTSASATHLHYLFQKNETLLAAFTGFRRSYQQENKRLSKIKMNAGYKIPVCFG